ncbi:MAG: sodium:proton antiporter [Desulfopila sp.]|jgi:NhaP-type Na+/H+ or K+/H+ antiporter|nr:sodium:proton antiporter [Desulfopila sp.]
MTTATISLIAVIFGLCILCQWAAWRMKLPAILFLLLSGITAGPILGLIHPETLLGDLLFPFVSLSVAIILFEGSLTLKFKEIKGLHVVVRNMLSIGAAVTWIITTIATRLILDISWEVATLFGAIMVVTGPTVVAPILRAVRPVPSVSNILRWESIVIDPIGAALAVLVFEFIVSGGGREALGHTLVTFSQLVFLGSIIGCIAGYCFGLCLRYHFIPEFLHTLAALAMVFASFALANFFQPESGLVTVTVFGIWLANMKNIDLEHILAFKETLSILLISLLFIVLAARLDFSTLQQLGWQALLICLVLQFLARPLSIAASAMGSSLSQGERHFLAWIAPRGIVAAAISSLFALKLEGYGHADAPLLVPLTFMVIIFTVLVQSLTAGPIAKLLKVTLPEPNGFLIFGSNHISRAIAKALLKSGVKVLITDNNATRLTKATKDGIPNCLGRPIAQKTGYNVELLGLGTLLALSAHESENVAATFHYREEFGKSNIYSLFPHRTTQQFCGTTLFSKQAGYTLLSRMVEEGATIQRLKLQEKFDLQTFLESKGPEAVPLFAVDPRKHAYCFNTENIPSAGKDWHILYLA